jgi:hypothetical protein
MTTPEERKEPTGQIDELLDPTHPMTALHEVHTLAHQELAELVKLPPGVLLTPEQQAIRDRELLEAFERLIAATEAHRAALASHAELLRGLQSIVAKRPNQAQRFFEKAADHARDVAHLLHTRFERAGAKLRGVAERGAAEWKQFAEKVRSTPARLEGWARSTGRELHEAAAALSASVSARYLGAKAALKRFAIEAPMVALAVAATGRDIAGDAKRALQPLGARVREWMQRNGERFDEHRADLKARHEAETTEQVADAVEAIVEHVSENAHAAPAMGHGG